jgi:putative flippase GtrA
VSAWHVYSRPVHRRLAIVLRTIIETLVKPFFTPRFVKFAVVGASGVVVNLGVLALLKALRLHINLASALAIEISLLSNFLVNHAWTFRDRRQGAAGFLGQALRFHLVCLIGAGIQFLVFVVMNMVWLLTLFDAETVTRYHMAADSWNQRWLWRPFVDPPAVGDWVYLSQLVGIACGTFWNYLLSFYWTFAARRDLVREIQSGEDHGT